MLLNMMMMMLSDNTILFMPARLIQHATSITILVQCNIIKTITFSIIYIQKYLTIGYTVRSMKLSSNICIFEHCKIKTYLHYIRNPLTNESFSSVSMASKKKECNQGVCTIMLLGVEKKYISKVDNETISLVI